MQFDLSGVPEVHALLKEISADFGNSVERKLARAALGAGLTQMARLIRAEAPTRKLKSAVGTRNQRQKGKQIYGAKAGLNVGKKNGRAPHAHFFVLGTKERRTKKGRFTGKVEPHKFVRRAIESGERSVVNAMLERIRKRLPIEITNVFRRHQKTQVRLPQGDTAVIIGGTVVSE